MTIAFVQVATNNLSVNGTTLGTAFTNHVQQGNLLILTPQWQNVSSASIVSTVSDTLGNSYYYASVASLVQGGTTAPTEYSNALYYCVSKASGANTTTFVLSATATNVNSWVAEYQGVNAFDNGSAAMNIGAGTNFTVTSGNFVTRFSNTLLVGTTYPSGPSSGTFAAGSGFTQRLQSGNTGGILEDQIVTTSGTYAITASDFTDDDPVVGAAFYWQGQLPTDSVFFGMT